MDEYYGDFPYSESLAHWGVRGMKWGVRKAVDRTGTGRIKSNAYSDAEKKLKRVTMAGGLAGAAIYAASHRDQMRQINGRPKSKKKSQSQKYFNTPEKRRAAQQYRKQLDEAYARSQTSEAKRKRRRSAISGHILEGLSNVRL